MTKTRIAVPDSWVSKENPDLFAEFWADESGERGLLQISKFPPDLAEYLRTQDDLGAIAAQVGSRLDGFGTSSGSKMGNCAMGRFGMAAFPQGKFPVMLLWITVSDGAAFKWTWFSADPSSLDVRDALQAVMLSQLES